MSYPVARTFQTEIPPIDFRAELNDEQYEAVTAEPGPALVLAGAGSGKTRTLTYRVAYLLTRGVAPEEILLLTFTNKAAREMLHRVEELTGIPGRRFWGGTFHHIGHRILRVHGETVGLGRDFTILDQQDAEAFLGDLVKEKDPGFFKDKANPRARQLGEVFSLARNTRLELEESVRRFHPQHEHLTGRMFPLFEQYMAGKRKQQVVDYDDLLEYLLKLLLEDADTARYYRERFRHVLVDEYQDTNTLQAGIVDTIGSHHRIMAVGDDAQCIYSWRGANYENIVTFPDRHPNTAIHKIETNYRSSPEILTLANRVLVNQIPASGFHKELRAFRESRARPYLVQTMDTREQAQFVIKRLEGLTSEGYNLSDVAVLYRAHYQAMDLQMELARLSIPFQITSGVRFFEQAHIRDLVAQLRFTYNPNDVTAFQRVAGLLPKVGPKTATRLHGLALEQSRKQGIPVTEALLSEGICKKAPKAASEEWVSLMQSLKDIAETGREAAPARTVQVAIEGWYGDYLRGAYSNYHSRQEDLRSLVGFAGRFDEMQDLLAQLVLLNSETSDRSVDPEADAVRLTTVHQAKGLEFPVVFVIGLSENLFPLKRAVEQGSVEEERRLFYVSVTRAKDELYLCHPAFAGGNGPPIRLRPSCFLEELPTNLYETLRIQRQRVW